MLAAVNEHATITSPDSASTVPAGPVEVEGSARGFEGTVILEAFVAGRSRPPLDQVVTSGGSMADAEPYRATVDLTPATAGDLVTLLVRGDTGLETDPGDFSAVPVRIG